MRDDPLQPGSAAAQPRSIGPYRILEELGHGGMGVVYKAEQREPVRRLVALKVVQAGIGTKEVLARFQLERRALAAMSHRCIAKVLDAGATDKGEPFFVMELVEGLPLTDYCDKHRLSLNDRLRLFQQVCDGVQHAHLKGVVHRDLKPGNVLVVREGDAAVPKILDFGLAKATNRDFLDATLFTEKDRVLGTPEYMSPEQAAGDGEGIDARADIYSLGVMLYELLCGELPFPTEVLRRAGALEALRLIREQEPAKPSTKLTSRSDSQALAEQRRTSVAVLRRALAGDLDWIALKAMAKEPERRYDAATALAADVGRYLEHLPVLAGPPSLRYRVKKFVRRYRVQVIAATAVLVAIVGGGIGTALGFAEANARAEENARIAKERDSKVREFDQLAGVPLYDRAIADEKRLYPPWPRQIEAMEKWLREDAGRLLAMQPEIERTVHDLEARALPATPEELEADRKSHPRFAEFEQLTWRVASLRYAQAIRDGKAKLVVPDLPTEIKTKTVIELDTLAWDRMAPKAKSRKVHGEEALSLACARAAVAKTAGTAEEYERLDTLAFALLANGQDAEAAQTAAAALAKAPADNKPEYEGYQRELMAAVSKPAEILAAAQQQIDTIASVIGMRRTFRFELESQRFLHDTLVELLTKIDSLAQREKADVELRLRWAKQIQELSLHHPHGRHTWAEARAAIAASDRYKGRNIELWDEDVIGLVPIDMNPQSKLWEFYDLRSAWDGKRDPKDIAIPEPDGEGRIQVGDDTGIVFVLLPGGTFAMGSQKEDPGGPNYDEQALPNWGPVHDVTLAPFFSSKYELTQGQWARLWSGDESLRQPCMYKATTSRGDEEISLANPVEQVDWAMCDSLLRRHGMVLPTEAQWEYGCRAGSTTPWLCGFDELQRCANLADATAKRFGITWKCEPWTDGHVVHARVGSYLPNGFGLHDVQGNVIEWCLDEYGTYYGAARPGDGLRLQGDGSSDRCRRGSSFSDPAGSARSALRLHLAPAIRMLNLGCRPARALRL